MPTIGKVALIACLLAIGNIFIVSNRITPEEIRPAQLETVKLTEPVEMDAENLMPVEF